MPWAHPCARTHTHTHAHTCTTEARSSSTADKSKTAGRYSVVLRAPRCAQLRAKAAVNAPKQTCTGQQHGSSARTNQYRSIIQGSNPRTLAPQTRQSCLLRVEAIPCHLPSQHALPPKAPVTHTHTHTHKHAHRSEFVFLHYGSHA